VSDIFHEVDEEVRREQLKRLWDRYGTLIIAGAVVVVLAVAGLRGYLWWEARQAAEAGAAFETATTLSEEGKHAEAQAAFAKLAQEGTAGYRVLAQFREAAELARQDRAAAVKIYDELANAGTSQELRDLAQLRAGLLLVDSAPYGDMQQRLEPLTGSNGAFRHTARELLALSAWRAGNAAEARRWSAMIMDDTSTPPGTRSRINMLLALLPADGKG
jgi:hypothetical protein